MSAANFDNCMAFIFEAEGGYVDDPRDPGGATNMGITLGTLSRWRGTTVTKDDVKNLQKPEATAIYRANYWNVIRGDDLPTGVDLAVFDAAVNLGNGRAAKMLQTVVGVTADGAIGPVTIAAVDRQSAPSVIEDFGDARKAFYESLATFVTFGRGWIARTDEATALANQMADA